MPVRPGQRKHLWSPGRWRAADVSTCGAFRKGAHEGCGAQIERIAVSAVTRAEGLEEEKRHNVYVYRYRESESAAWRLVWEVPTCPR